MRPRLILMAAVGAISATAAFAQRQTLARLSHEPPDLPHTIVTARNDVQDARPARATILHESVLSRSAARALFVDSNLDRARRLAAQALRRNSQDAEALFVQMEVAGMEADETTLLDAATRLCEAGTGASDDPRLRLAAARLRESAANTTEFRKIIPRLQALLANSASTAGDLHLALLNAAMDGTPGLDPYVISRAAGIVTDWRIVGPLGRHSILDLDQQQLSSADDLVRSSYQGHPVENFQFPDGRIVLPSYLSHPGVFYASAHFASLVAGRWTVNAESAGALEVYVDGQRVLRTPADGSRSSADFEATAGLHRVQIRFPGSRTPIRISFTRAIERIHIAPGTRLTAQELTYRLAAGDYAEGEFASAVKQIGAVASAQASVPLLFLLAQSESRQSRAKPADATTWQSLRSLSSEVAAADEGLGRTALSRGQWTAATTFASHVLAAQPSNTAALETLTEAWASMPDPESVPPIAEGIWAERIAAHPSCARLLAAMDFYQARGQLSKWNAIQPSLNGCAPESLDYARSLGEQGDYAAATRALQRLLAAAPLNRDARQMLVRDLQLAGDDAGAQRAAAEWRKIAPNSVTYHRLAVVSAEAQEPNGTGDALPTDFYGFYRRDALAITRQSAQQAQLRSATILLDDHVAICRPDGSVSLYVHHVRRLPSPPASEEFRDVKLAAGVQVLTRRVIHADGTFTTLPSGGAIATLQSGDAVDEEYIVHYAGDGGIPEHSEAFQFVFGSFNEPVLHARFVVLTPAGRADRGAVIATGDAPAMRAEVRSGMLERSWESDGAAVPFASSARNFAIVRVVEEENGWSVPSNAEHQRRIETIHPGPRPEDS